jgi:hypothetical protein
MVLRKNLQHSIQTDNISARGSLFEVARGFNYLKRQRNLQGGI